MVRKLINKSPMVKVLALAFVAALAISFVGLTHAEANLQLQVTVNDACGPLIAKVTIVNGPDDGAQGFTDSNGQLLFPNLNPGVFYLHIESSDHTAKDTDAIVLTANQNITITLDRTNGSCPTQNFVNLNFVVRDVCTSAGLPGAAVHIDQNFGNGQDRTTDGSGFANFGVLTNTDIGWSVSKSGFTSANGSVNSGTSDKTVNVTLNRDCSTPPETCQDPNATNFGGPLPCTYPPGVCQDPNATNFGGPLPCTYPPNPDNHPPIGSFDAADCDIIGGWAFDPDSSSTSIVVEIYANGPEGIGTRIFSGATTGLRPDVNAAYGITGNHGFTIFTPQSLKDGGTHEIWVYAQDSTTHQNTLFDNRKFLNTATCATPPTNNPPQGVLDVADCTRIAGWATDSDTPNSAVLIDIYLDGPAGSGQFIATITANQSRSDVGAHAFDIPTPAQFKGTASHTIYVYAIDTARITNAHLIGSPKTIGPCVVVQSAQPGTISITKAVRNVTAGQTAFVNSISASPLDQVEFQMRVSVSSNGSVSNVVFSDTLPSRLNLIGNSITVDGTPSGSSLSGINLGTMTANQTKIVVFRATVADTNQFPVGGTTLTNTANVTSSNNSDSASASVVVNKVIIQDNGTIGITKAVRNVSQNQAVFSNSAPANPGEVVEFQMQVSASNNGPVSNVVLTDSLPLRLNFVPNSVTVDGVPNGSNLSSITLGNFTAGQTRTVVLRATVAAASLFNTGTSTLINAASVTSNSNGANASASVTVTINQTSINLAIVKLARNISQGQTNFVKSVNAAPGDQIQFQLQVTATGNTPAQNVTVTDTLPANMTLTSGTLSNNLGTINSGSTQTVTLNATLAGDSNFSCGSSTLINTAQAASSNTSSASDTANVIVTRSNNCNTTTTLLSVTKQARNITQGQTTFSRTINAAPGDQIQFQIQVTNTGTGAVQNVRVDDVVTSAFNLTSGSSTTNLGTLNPGASQTVTLNATLAGDSNFSCGSNTVFNTATTQGTGSNFPSDTATVFVTRTNNCNVASSASLTLTKEVRNLTTGANFSSQVNASSNDQVQFRLTVRNNSGSNVTAVNVRVADNLPSGLSFVSGTLQVDNGTSFGNLFGGNQFLGNLFAGQSRVLTFQATVNGSSSQTLTNTATASADNSNTASTQASVFVSSVLGSNVNLILSKRAFNQTLNVNATTTAARAGDVIIYTLAVQNSGNTAANNYVFQDDISDVLALSQLQTFDNATFNMGNLSLAWPATTIPAGGTVEKTFSVKINSAFAAGTDNVMTNVFGNTVNVSVVKPTVLGAFIAPKTGATATIAFVLSFITVLGFAAYKKKEKILSTLAAITAYNNHV